MSSATPIVSAAWHCENQRALLVAAPLAAQVLHTPRGEGLVATSVAGVPLANTLLMCVSLQAGADTGESPPVDFYARGGDLVATFEQAPTRPGRVQLYWRIGAAPAPPVAALATIDLQVSVQTSSWHTWPEMWTSSQMPGRQFLRLDDHGRWFALPAAAERPEPSSCCHLIRLVDHSLSYVEMLYPSDAAADSPRAVCEQAGSADAVVVRHRLFAENLEKGVIRRARIRGLFVPRETDEALAREAYAGFCDAEPPLES